MKKIEFEYFEYRESIEASIEYQKVDKGLYFHFKISVFDDTNYCSVNVKDYIKQMIKKEGRLKGDLDCVRRALEELIGLVDERESELIEPEWSAPENMPE